MKLIDSHCHIDFEQFSQDRTQVLQAARANHVEKFIVPAVMQSTWDGLIALCEQHQGLHYALGLHPMFIQAHERPHLSKLADYLSHYRPCAVGEIGLDFYDRSLSCDKQKEFLEAQLALACEHALPVILHVRKAHEEVLVALRKYPVIGGIVHAYNGSLQQAERYLKANFKFGFGGMLTFERSSHLRHLAKHLPIESIVLETDSPDMTVQQHRGERNSPEYLHYCCSALAEIRQMSVQQISDITFANTLQTLNL